jgi:hypothetical protein
MTIRTVALAMMCAAMAVPTAGAEDAYGGASLTVHTVQAYEFLPAAGDSTNMIANNFGARACAGPCLLVAPVMLPTGALVEDFELEACDTDLLGQVAATFTRVGSLETTTTVLAQITSGVTPGCALFHVTVPPHTVDNRAATYTAQVGIAGTGLATRFQAVRISYRLQVSPAPATATFPNDVPTTHPFFRFVEALARAGITGGCGAGAYCPDQPVTRGQMAVFLATALGLHFPN